MKHILSKNIFLTFSSLSFLELSSTFVSFSSSTFVSCSSFLSLFLEKASVIESNVLELDFSAVPYVTDLSKTPGVIALFAPSENPSSASSISEFVVDFPLLNILYGSTIEPSENSNAKIKIVINTTVPIIEPTVTFTVFVLAFL